MAITIATTVVAAGCSDPFSGDEGDDVFRGGYMLSFDDCYVHEWYDQRDIFNEFDVSATFFVTRFSQLKPGQIDMLKDLEGDGHEIDEIFYSPGDGPVVYGLGIDKVFDIPLGEIEEAFRRAQENSEVVIFFAHRPVETAREGRNEIERSYLESIFKLARAYKLKSLTILELP